MKNVYHVAMAIVGLDARQDLVIVTAIDQNLRIVLDALLKNGHRSIDRGILVVYFFVFLHCFIRFFNLLLTFLLENVKTYTRTDLQLETI